MNSPDYSQYRCQPEKQVYCPHMDYAHSLLKEWLVAWDAGSDSDHLYQRTSALLARTEVESHEQHPGCNACGSMEREAYDRRFVKHKDWCPCFARNQE